MKKNNKFISKNNKIEKWNHAGGKLRELGAESLSDSELLAILIGVGIKEKNE